MVHTVEIVSLSSGIIGETRVAHERRIGIERLEAMGLRVKFAPHALKGLAYIQEHPEDRAADLVGAYADPEVDMILCAIGGDDTYRLLPYLFEGDRLKNVADSRKIFLGFSDTTINHLVLHRLGVKTFYGQSFLADICELEADMLPYSRRFFEELVRTGTIREIRPADVWYEERKSFGPDQTGVPRVKHADTGFELLQGPAVFSGKVLGGCIDSLYDLFDGTRYADMPVLCEKYRIFPEAEDWKGRILLLETSEEKPSPEKYRRGLEFLKARGVFGQVSGVLAGKPMDEACAAEYKEMLVSVIADPALPVLWNVNIGHAAPRCIIPFGVDAAVDARAQVIRFESGKQD